MKLTGITLALTALVTGNALAQTPSVGGLLNNYSFTLPGLPNYGIAQGSIFDIFGTNLASTSTPLQSTPPKTLEGVSISVTVNGTTTQPLIYFVSAGQIAAVLPSATPVGTGTLTVTTAAGTSAPFAIQVVQSAFGLLTKNNGSGPVAGFNANNSYASMSYNSAANPNEILELWGTGLGPVDNDAVGVAVSAPIEVDIGGVSATVLYHGRSGYTGLDQINVKVPSGVSGCNVSVAVVTGNYVSNFGTLAVAASGRTCSDPAIGLSSEILTGLPTSGDFKTGFISIGKSTTASTTIAGITIPGTTTDFGSASFSKITYTQFTTTGYGLTSIGSCSLLTFSGQTPPSSVSVSSLNAGPAININGPEGALAMSLQTAGDISFYSTPAKAAFIPDTGGTFHFDNGSGGPDVGPFTVDLTMGAPLVWTELNTVTTVSRQDGYTVHWTGGDADTFVTITGISIATDDQGANALGGFFTCNAPVAALHFTVPPSVLLSLPASTTIAGFSLSTLSVGNSTQTVYFHPSNVDLAGVNGTVSNTASVTYQ